jgi:hypothetical protein
VFYGAVARCETIDTSGGLTDALVRAYSRGQCVALAVGLHDLTGWPIALVCAVPAHVAGQVAPVDELGHAHTDTLTDPYVTSGAPRGIAPGARPEDIPEILGRRHFRHAVVLSPHGPVDVTGKFTWGSYGLPAGQEPAACACAPGCACPKPCCLDTSGLVVVRTSRDIAVRLDQRTRYPGLRHIEPAAAATQNWDAGADVARLVHANLPARLTRPTQAPRVTRQAPAAAGSRGR